MATSKSKGGADIKFDEFIKHVKPDPNSTDQVVLMTGYVGPSDKDDRIRLYSDASLSEYIDIPRADILYSSANTGDPLGGSQLWVKSTAAVTHNDPQAFAQGSMYADYMQNTFDPGFASHDSPGITKICPVPVLTKAAICNLPTKFICPTPASKVVICTIKTLTGCPVTITKTITNHPSIIDGCPSQFVCPTNTWQTGGGTVINPGQQAQAPNYAAGDIYGDYMQNTYQPAADPSGTPASTPLICLQPVTNPAICYIHASTPIICVKSIIKNSCPVSIGQVYCITHNNQISLCHPCYPNTIFTITPTTVQTGTIQTIHVGAQAPANYAGGDIYGDYMQNTYQPAAAASPAAVTTPQLCLQPVTNAAVCHIQASLPVVCIKSIVKNTCPVITTPLYCLTHNKVQTICSPCYQTTHTTITITPTTVQTINTGGTSVIFQGQQAAPDYTGGDMYGDYMQNTYQPAADPAAAPVAATTPQVCIQLNTANIICQPSRFIVCRISVYSPCITHNNAISLCRPCYPTTTITLTHTTTVQTTTIQTGTIQTGTIARGQFTDPYAGY